MKKLKLQWVSDSIGNDYKKWGNGDTVLIQAQTGTGKTHFIKNVLLDELNSGERLLFVCNRTNLKRQLKRDLLKKYNLPIPTTLEELDEIKTIADKVTITSYHNISNVIRNSMYINGTKCDISHYAYIVFDECHFLFSDSSFNNKTRFVYDEVVKEYYPFSIKIFISATMEEIKGSIINWVNSHKDNGFGMDNVNIHEYSTGIDYSYVNTKYFKKLDNIINLIKNDKSDEKWMIFISDIERDGNKIIEELGEDKCSLIKRGTESDELDSIINNSKFNKKVLICTKVLDNGININDPLLKNIVIMTWDRITFIQMLGRKRIDIDNAEKINLYIPTRYKKSFMSKLQNLRYKKMQVDLYKENEVQFNLNYDNDLDRFKKVRELFYRDTVTGKYKVNMVGYNRLHKDIQFAEYMVELFEYLGEYAFIFEQLRWMGLSDYTPEENMIEYVVVDEEINQLQNYLNSVEGKKLFADEQQELSDLIINELITLSTKTDYRTKKLKPSTIECIIREQLGLPYAVSKPKQETKGEMRKKKYIIITKLN